MSGINLGLEELFYAVVLFVLVLFSASVYFFCVKRSWLLASEKFLIFPMPHADKERFFWNLAQGDQRQFCDVSKLLIKRRISTARHPS